MKIPKLFKLLGHTINTVYESNLSAKYGNTGEARYTDNTIAIQSIVEGFEIRSITEQGHVFCHEMTHHILHHMGEHELCGNEKFVELFSGLLHQALTTMEYE